MGSIFDNSTFTIIAAEGEDANFGLPGLEGISRPRKHNLETFTFRTNDREILELYIRRRSKTKWARRGWTFQEDTFSRRRLKFDKYGVRWECGTTVCEEHRESDDFLVGKGRGWSEKSHLLRPYPSIPDFAFLVWSYNKRELTYGEDGLRAFAGVLTALSHKFQGGFNNGLPVMFLDVALLWQINGACERRVASNLNAESQCSPSWSWAGWKGEIRYMLWGTKCDYLRRESAIERTIPMVEWFSQESKESNPVSITHQNSWCRHRTKYLDGANDLPPGWTKHEIDSADQEPKWNSPQTHYYQHDSIPEIQFWYPIPLPVPHQDPIIHSWGRLLSCRAQSATLRVCWNETDGDRAVIVRALDGSLAGILHYPREDLASRPLENRTLVAISQGCLLDGYGIHSGYPELLLSECPYGKDLRQKKFPERSGKYEFYNVLLVEWEDGVAYRKALGRIMKEVWEHQDIEMIDLILG
jgi:hypothetical protein